MKKTLVFFGLTATLLALAFLGWGCHRAMRIAQRPTPNAQQAVDWRTSGTKTVTSTDEITPMEPQALAYLLLTKEAKVTVARGQEQMLGVSEMELLEGDTVRVVSGEARLLYPDTGMSVLEQGTKVTLMPDGQPKAGGLRLQLMLEAGRVWTRLERLLGTDETLSVDASDVVATVRGTGFGIRFVNGEVDVTVADHQVRVTTRTMLNTGREIAESVLLAAGSGLRIDPSVINKMTDMRALLLKNIRKLSDTEKQQPGYLFGLRSIAPAELERPLKPFRWHAVTVLDSHLQSKLTPEQIKRAQASILWLQAHQAELLQAERLYQAGVPKVIRFQPPLRGLNLLDVIPPTSTPRVTGPVMKQN